MYGSVVLFFSLPVNSEFLKAIYISALQHLKKTFSTLQEFYIPFK